MGISNVSFGLPPAGREVLNSVFLYECTRAGLDLAIVNTERLVRYASLPENEKALAAKVLLSGKADDIIAFINYFREAVPESNREERKAGAEPQLSLDERLIRYIVEGSKEGLFADLDLKLEQVSPLAIINGPLLSGMDRVGELFRRNELILTEVLQSAEVMRAAVDYLKPHMNKKKATAVRGTILLATVKGDVHDIGKNLVSILFSSNGYQVIDLGTKVAPAELIQAVKQHRPDLIGLSGLLVRSAHQMVVTVEELCRAGISLPVLVGGAALSAEFTRRKIAPAYDGGTVVYAKDAMHGLELAKRLLSPAAHHLPATHPLPATPPLSAGESTAREQHLGPVPPESAGESRGHMGEGELREESRPLSLNQESTGRSPAVPVLWEVPVPPDFRRHIRRDIDLDEVWTYLNPAMLYSHHLGLRGPLRRLLAEGGERARKLVELVESLKDEARRQMQVQAVWRFFPAGSEGNRLLLFNPDVGCDPDAACDPDAGSDHEGVLAAFTFPRQAGGERLCLADFVNPITPGPWGEAPPRDSVCLFAVTAGAGIAALSRQYAAAGELLKSYAVQALALQTAEAAAEWQHRQIRSWWGFPDHPALSMAERMRGHYRGRRYSFGYPACPDLSQQELLFKLLRPEEIGIQLTEEYMMDPEASLTAIVVSHPQAKYFTAAVPDDEGVRTTPHS